MKSLVKSVVIITIFSVLTRFIGFIFRIFLSRSIGAEALGLYQVALSVFGVLLTIFASGIPLVISKLTAKYRVENNKSSEHKMVSTALIMSIIMSVGLCLIVLACNKLLSLIFTDERCVMILIILLPAVIFSAIYSVLRGVFWGHSNFFAVCITEFFEQLVRVILCVIMLIGVVSGYAGALNAAWSLTISCFLSMILTFIIYFANGGKLKKPSNSYKEILKSSAPITGVRVSTTLIQPIMAILVPLRLMAAGYTSSQAMSLFGVAMGMTLPLLFVPCALVGSLSMALIPDISSALAKKDEEHISGRINSSISFAIFASAFLIPFYIAVGDKVGLFFFDNAQSGYLLAKSAWIMLPLGLVNITSSILNALGLETKSFKNNLVGAVLLLICSYFLPAIIGIDSVIVGMGLCMTAVSILNLRMINKRSKIKIKIIKPLIKFAILMIPTVAITSFIANIMIHYFTLFFTLAISCSIGAVMLFYLSIIFKVADFSFIFVKIKKFKLKSMPIFRKKYKNKK